MRYISTLHGEARKLKNNNLRILFFKWSGDWWILIVELVELYLELAPV